MRREASPPAATLSRLLVTRARFLAARSELIRPLSAPRAAAIGSSGSGRTTQPVTEVLERNDRVPHRRRTLAGTDI